MRLTPFHKADLLTGIAIAMGLVGIFPMTDALVHAYLAPGMSSTAGRDDGIWWALWAAWMVAMVYVGLVLPSRYLRHGYENWRTVPGSRQELRERREADRRRWPRDGASTRADRRKRRMEPTQPD